MSRSARHNGKTAVGTHEVCLGARKLWQPRKAALHHIREPTSILLRHRLPAPNWLDPISLGKYRKASHDLNTLSQEFHPYLTRSGGASSFGSARGRLTGLSPRCGRAPNESFWGPEPSRYQAAAPDWTEVVGLRDPPGLNGSSRGSMSRRPQRSA